MSEFETQTRREDSEHKKPNASELAASLTDKFENGELTTSIDELRELADGVGSEWQQQGYELNPIHPVEYVDPDGGLLMIARRQGEFPSGYATEKAKTGQRASMVRILMDGAVIDVTIPEQLEGWSAKNIVWRGGGDVSKERAGDEDIIYQLRSHTDITKLSPEMQLLVEKFGSKLTLRSSSVETEHGCVGVAMSELGEPVRERSGDPKWKQDYDASVAAEEEKRRAHDAEYAAAAPQREAAAAANLRRRHEETAHQYENIAQGAADKVEKGRFMTAGKYKQLRDQMYRRTLTLLLNDEYFPKYTK